MKFLIVVLAVASLCLAEPEADPQFLYSAYYPYANYAYAPSFYYRPAIANGYGYNYPGGYTHVNRLDKREAEPEADAQLLLASPYNYYTYPYATYAHATAVVPQIRPYGPYNCVTAEGCAVQTLKDHGLAKREAEADASSLLYAPAYYNAYAYNAYNPYYYAARPAVLAPVVATTNKHVTYTHLGANPIQPTTVVEQQNTVVGHTFVKREAEAEADASSLLYAPAYYNNVYAHNAYAYNAYAYNAYNPYYYAARPAVVAPVVATVNTPVTYTHLGAHPIQPSTVVEQQSAVVGHALL
jgi:hypothetical protein